MIEEPDPLRTQTYIDIQNVQNKTNACVNINTYVHSMTS